MYMHVKDESDWIEIKITEQGNKEWHWKISKKCLITLF